MNANHHRKKSTSPHGIPLSGSYSTCNVDEIQPLSTVIRERINLARPLHDQDFPSFRLKGADRDLSGRNWGSHIAKTVFNLHASLLRPSSHNSTNRKHPMEVTPPAFQIPVKVGKPSFLPSYSRPSTSSPLHKLAVLANPKRKSRSYIVALHKRSEPGQKVDWSTLTPADFDDKLANDTLSICLIGMSNCGKSHWASQLHRKRGFKRVCVDEKIEHAIKPELSALGYSGIDGLAAWMGFPTDEKFAVHQQKYLDLEESITASTVPGPGNTVLDTTGSVCYLSNPTLLRLQSDYLVIHLEASDDMLEVMTDKYFATPKPVVWGDSFGRLAGETPEEALRRCYPILLRHRRRRYEDIAHLAIPASISLSQELDIEGFVELVRNRLRKRT